MVGKVLESVMNNGVTAHFGSNSGVSGVNTSAQSFLTNLLESKTLRMSVVEYVLGRRKILEKPSG